jgi:type IV pilus assembly protein PilF
MPRTERIAVPCVAVLATLVLLSACGRPDFIRPSAARGDSTQVAPDYTIRPDRDAAATLRARAALREGATALREDRLDDAARAAREAIRGDAGSDAHTLLALVLERRGEADAAGREYARALALAPDSGAELNNMGAWLCRNGRAAEAMAHFDRALADRRYATPSSALANAGACAVEAGQPARAERDLRAALAIDPRDPVALEALARHLHAQGNAFEARAFSQRRLEAAPPTAAALQLASQIETALGDTAAAERYLQRLRADGPQGQPVLHGDSGTR